ncbi:MAG: 4'-phosphopantetheinyl transferase family protein [Candidatus Acidiferrales bacterium]
MTPQNWIAVALNSLQDAAVCPPLASGEVHIWRASQTVEPPVLSRLHALLDADEKARAERFVFQRDRDRFIVAHGILRQLLAAYIGCAPAEIDFDYGPQGKPSLKPSRFNRAETTPFNRAEENSRVRFNMSHSQGLAVFAFALDRDLGIDVELIRADFGGQDIAQRYFSRDEVAELMSLPPEIRAQAFFLCWSRKEAYIKARGQGLQIPLTSFSVSLTPDAPECLSADDASRWELRSFQPKEDYAGALITEAARSSVAEGRFSLRFFDWQP